MKKKIIISVVVLVGALLAYQAYIFTTASEDNINPIYLIPDDAVFIVDTERPIDAWDEISNSNIWKHLQKNDYFSEITESLNTLDQTFKEQKKLIEFIGERDILISIHVYKPKSYGLFYTVDIQKLSKLRFLKNSIAKLAGEGFEVTKRTYKDHEITELYNKKERETLYLSFIKNQLIASYTHVLIEKSIDQYQTPVIGRDVNFIEINKETPEDGFFKMFVQYKYLNKYLACFSNKMNSELLNTIEKSWLYSGFNIGLKESTTIQAEGFTNFDLTSESYLRALQKSGKGKRTIAKVAPKNTALYLSFAFDDFDTFYENFESIKEENEDTFEAYNEQVKEVENMLDINLKDDVFSWIGSEIALLHINDVISKKKQNLAVVLTTKNIDKAREKLNFILSKIKEKTPLKFKQINYKGYDINFLDLKGFFKILAGNLFAKMEKPYFTIIDDYVIFSNSPNTLKEIINTQLIGFTLASNQNYLDFNDQFDEKSSVFAYVNTPYIYDELLTLTDSKTRNSIRKNKDYIVSFSQVGLQLISKGDFFENYLVASYENPVNIQQQQIEDKKLRYELIQKISKEVDTVLTEETVFKLPEIYPNDLSTSEFIKKYENGQVHIEVELKNGLKHGDFKEYYRNGNVKISGKFKKDVQIGTWKAYDKESEDLLFKKRF
ncbi:Protein of unknown function [Tenacibaculum sp. MAR_2009_124]|uniref:DUF3352 domain-containing protein n=1 Tax=Tenacibaculum sp. MAR_2009_124 TaxID=1250059 RepID=UPI000896969C|nr:DUF3352 domain-containing protein [Tenacibaculum sp. MAR_2009_124]SEB40161.1 Protein of unknown function [Tenacibaculum sp. MAR_2009_124]